MSANSNIEWCNHTFNPWIGCTKVSPGCDNCYAARQDAFRRWTPEGWGGPRKRTKTWGDPKKWNAQHQAFFAQHGRRQGVFCASLGDVLDNAVPDDWRMDLCDLIDATPNLDWLLLTKRIGNAERMLPTRWLAPGGWPKHVRLGISITSQAELERDLLKLIALACPNFVSAEPLLGPLDFTSEYFTKKLGAYPFKGLPSEHRTRLIHLVDWLIAGGESGPSARPAHPDWLRSLRDQCQTAGVPFFFKQWGAWAPALADQHPRHTFATDKRVDIGQGRTLPFVVDVARVGKKAAGRLLDGREWNEVPSS